MIVGRHRLLEPGEVEVFQLAAEPDRMVCGEAAAGVAHQRHAGPDRLAHGGDPLDVFFHMRLPDPHLHTAEAFGDVAGGFLRQLVGRRRQPQAGAGIDRDAVARGAQQVGDRLAERLALGIPQRGVDAGESEDRHALVAEEVELAPHPLPEALGVADIFAQEGRLQAVDHRAQHLDAPSAQGEQEALAGDADVGVDEDQYGANAVVTDAARVAGRTVERHLDEDCPEIGDAHACLTPVGLPRSTLVPSR